MKIETHTIQTRKGLITITLEIHRMDKVEAIDIYDCDPMLYSSGGWRIEGSIANIPAGSVFSSGGLGSVYWGESSEDAAKLLVNEWIQDT